MAVGHAKDVIRLAHEVGGEHPAALVGDVHPEFAHGVDGMGGGGLAVQRAQTRRQHTEAAAAMDRPAEQRLRHGAAADVAGANK
jgi:hypothetical protein